MKKELTPKPVDGGKSMQQTTNEQAKGYYVDKHGAAAILGKTPKAVSRLRERNEIRAFRPNGGKLSYWVPDLHEYVQKRDEDFNRREAERNAQKAKKVAPRFF